MKNLENDPFVCDMRKYILDSQVYCLKDSKGNEEWQLTLMVVEI